MNARKTILSLFVLGLALSLGLGEASAQSRRSTTGNPAAATISAAYQYRQKTLDRTNQNWSNYMRGVQQYRSPYSSTPLTLSNGYNHVWQNGLGQTIYSNRYSFNPNIGSNHNWYQLRPIR